jgi:predicted ATPase/class 3 adenylate cyclase/DNA-binding SARP family transcriptional activator
MAGVADPAAISTIAVLCTDLVDSTRLLADLGEAAFDDVRRRHFEVLRRALDACGGQEIKTLGDGILAVFTSAADALSCAVAMQQALARPAAPDHPQVVMRVGLALGDVVFEEGDVFGTPVVQAARLTAAARGGQILSTTVVRTVAGGRSSAVCTDLEPMMLKGLADPVPVCEVAWEPSPFAVGPGPGIGVLGPVVIVHRGVPTTLRSSRQLLLLAVLIAASGRVISQDELADVLWGDALPADPTAALQSQISRLRRALGPAASWLETAGSAGYRLAGGPARVDADRFAQLVGEARAGRREPDAALRDVETALGLWRGRPYLDVADHEAIRVAANGLEEQRADAAELRAELLLAVGRPGEAARAMDVLSREHPFRERPVELRMRALAGDGRHADALEVFAQFRRALADELGVDPSPELGRVQEEILRPEPSRDRTGPMIGLPGNSFLGRESDLATVTSFLERSRLVTLTGPGGVGKTRLALHTAVAVAHRYPDGVFSCELAAVTAPDAVVAAVVSTLGIKERAGQTETARIVEWLAAKRTLLILDNCEHVLDSAAVLVGAVLAQAPDVAVLATSRQRLGVAGEQRVPLAALPTPRGGALSGPAVELFAHRAAAVRPDFELTTANIAEVGELCRRLDGLPLAIELAAARVVSRSVGEIVADLDDRPARLTDRRRPVERHRSIDAVVGWSHGLLGPGEQVIFERLAVFAGGFTAEAAAAVAADDRGALLDDLNTLTEHSLLHVRDIDGRTRFAMLEPIRQYAEECLRRQGLLEQSRARHAAWAIRRAATADAGLRGPDEATWVRCLDAEVPNLRAAHSWCLERDPAGAVRLVGFLYWYAYFYGPSEILAWADQAIVRLGDSADPHLASAFATAALGAWRRGDLGQARALAERGIAADPAGDLERARFAWEALGDGHQLAGDYPRALAAWDQAMAGHLRAGDNAAVAVAAANRAVIIAYAGDVAGGRAELAAAASVIGATDNPSARAFCDFVAGELRLDDAPAEALVLLRSSAATARRVGNQFVAGIAGLSAVSCAARHGDPADSLEGYSELIEHWHRTGSWIQQWTTIRTLVETLARLGRYEPAAVLHGAAAASTTASPLVGMEAIRLTGAVETVRAVLGADGFERLQAHGTGLGDDRAVAYALRCLGDRRPEQGPDSLSQPQSSTVPGPA